jgi:hypothetical protein
MQNIPLEFDLLVLGNEPAGLWLLREFTRLFPEDAALKQKPTGSPKVGWLRLESTTQTLPLSAAIAHHYRIAPQPVFSAEIASPRERFRWSPAEVISRFPTLPPDLVSRFKASLEIPSREERKRLQTTLSQFPEILSYAQSLWKQVGKSRTMTPENLVWAALQCLELFMWPVESLVSEIPGLSIFPIEAKSPLTSIEELPKSATAGASPLYQVSFSSGESFLSRALVINSTVSELQTLSLKEPSLSWLSPDPQVLSPIAIYPQVLRFRGFSLPKNIQPLTLLVEKSPFPEPDLEMIPMTLESQPEGQTVTLWCTDRTDFSYEALSEKLAKAMGRFYQHFPEALEHLTTQSLSPGMATCDSAETRGEILRQIEMSRQGLYDLSLLHVRTRKKRIYNLLSALRCSLPYPLGPLTGAQEILAELFHQRWPSTRKKIDPPVATSS